MLHADPPGQPTHLSTPRDNGIPLDMCDFEGVCACVSVCAYACVQVGVCSLCGISSHGVRRVLRNALWARV